jgi:hypothetical protein
MRDLTETEYAALMARCRAAAADAIEPVLDAQGDDICAHCLAIAAAEGLGRVMAIQIAYALLLLPTAHERTLAFSNLIGSIATVIREELEDAERRYAAAPAPTVH